MIFKKAILANQNILRKTIKFPDGREVTLGPRAAKEYSITNKKDLDFLTGLRDIQICDLESKELHKLLMELPDLPNIGNDKNAKRFVWYDENEEYVLAELRKRGYVCERTGTDPDFIDENRTRGNLKRATVESLLEELKSRLTEDGSIKVSVMEVIGDPIETELDKMDFETIKAVLKLKGYEGLRKPKEVKNVKE
jgi:hypothetical protein